VGPRVESPPVYEKEVFFFFVHPFLYARVGCYVIGILVGQVGWIFVRYSVLELGSA